MDIMSVYNSVTIVNWKIGCVRIITVLPEHAVSAAASLPAAPTAVAARLQAARLPLLRAAPTAAGARLPLIPASATCEAAAAARQHPVRTSAQGKQQTSSLGRLVRRPGLGH